MQPVLDIQSRQHEESRIVLKWLGRLQDCLRDESSRLFSDATKHAGISREQLRSGDGLTHDHFDRVMDYIRQRVPDVIFRFMSELDYPTWVCSVMPF